MTRVGRRTHASRGAIALVAACALVAVLAPATAAAFGRNKVQPTVRSWQTLVTPHFEITYAVGAEELAVRGALLAERAYEEYADRLDHDLERRVPFILYASHGEFSQTNIADQLLGEGTGGFTEPARNRMVLPYDGSHADFVHVLRHELVHVFMFDMAFGSSRAMSSRTPFFRIPLWFAEGIAEWYSSGWDPEAEMFMRDAATNDYLWPLSMVGGFLVYKEGQAAMRYLSETYGEEKILEMWRLLGRTRNMDRTLRGALGLEMEDLEEDFRRHVRLRYWPAYGSLEEPEGFARRLTDHVEDRHGFAQRPAPSPDGLSYAYFSDRDGLVSLYVASTLDPEDRHRLAEGHRRDRFESLHSFRSGLSWSPDGREIVLIARSGSRETLHTVRASDGRVTRDLKLGLDTARQPAWSPDGRHVALVGTILGRTDLYLVDLEAGEAPASPWRSLGDGVAMRRLTDDAGDEGMPAWSPDGARLAFSHNPRAETVYEFEIAPDGNRRLLGARFLDEAAYDPGHVQDTDLVILDPATGDRVELRPERGQWQDPVWTGAAELAVVDDRDGVSNLARLHLDASLSAVDSCVVMTNVSGAAEQPAYAADADLLLFTGFLQGGYDIYAVDGYRDWSRRTPAGARPVHPHIDPPAYAARTTQPAPVRGAATVGEVREYKPSFQVDASNALAGGAVFFSPQAGLGMANVINLSDLLGDHRLSFLVNVYGSLENSDLAATYAMLRHRWDLSAGLFHFKNYYNSAFTSVGEVLPHDVFFSERNYGVFAQASYPFSTFRRFTFEVQGLTSERTEYGLDPTGFLVPGDKTTHRILQPSVNVVHDSAFYGYYGPVTGSRLSLYAAPSIPVGGATLDRQTYLVDWRQYWMPWRGNAFALRLMGAASEGRDPRAFVLGGPFTLRGYEFYDYQHTSHLAGSRLAMLNLEYRLPLLNALYFGWPGGWGFGPVGATLFFDAGAAWNDGLELFGRDEFDEWGMLDLRGDYGFGIRTRLGFLPLKFDWAWPTDLRSTGEGVFHFSIGSEY